MSACFASAVRVAAPVTAGARRRSARAAGARAPQRSAAVRLQNPALSMANGDRRRSLVKVAAEEGSAPKPPAPETPKEEDAKDAKGGLKEGQLTAIITGGISLVLGIGYLALVNAIGNRELLPPPPEALGM